MNKKEAFKKMWVEMAVRRPPDKEIIILGYNPKTGYITTTPANILLAQLNQTQTKEIFDNWKGKKDPHIYHTGYYITHWMYWYPPDLGEEEMEKDDPIIRHCSICEERQYPTKSGWVCYNGHGGVPSIEED